MITEKKMQSKSKQNKKVNIEEQNGKTEKQKGKNKTLHSLFYLHPSFFLFHFSAQIVRKIFIL